jgi:hypothetical protein
LEACKEKEKEILEERGEWKSDKDHEPSRPSIDRYFSLYCDRHSKMLLHRKVQKKSMM